MRYCVLIVQLMGWGQVKILDYALSDLEGEVTLHFPTPGMKFNSLVGQSGITGSASLGAFDEGDAPNCQLESINVLSTTLDKIVETEKIESLRLIKIDVEGFDCRVMEGGRKTIEKFQPFIIFEFNHHWEKRGNRKLRDALAVLDGYELYGVVSGVRRYLKKIDDPDIFTSGDILAVPFSKGSTI